MAFELVYTSIPHGIKQGSSGFCTAAYTNGLGPNVIMQLEGLSAYKPLYPHYDENADKNPVAFSHYICSVAGKNMHVLSRICFCGLDYTKRSNKLAHHIVPIMDEMELLKGGPSSVFFSLNTFLSSWTGDPKLFDSQKKLPSVKSQFRMATTWASYTGDAGWAGVLAGNYLKNPNKPAFIVFDPLKHLNLISLVDEALQLIPEKQRWSVTFNTYLTTLPAGVQCSWRFCIPGSDVLSAAKRTPNTLIIDLTKPMGPAPDEPLQQAARTGIKPPEPKTPAGKTFSAESNPATRPVQTIERRRSISGSTVPHSTNDGFPNQGKYQASAPDRSFRKLAIIMGSFVLVALLALGGAIVWLKNEENKRIEEEKRVRIAEDNRIAEEKRAEEEKQKRSAEEKRIADEKLIAEEKDKRQNNRNSLWKGELDSSVAFLEKYEQITKVCIWNGEKLDIQEPWSDLKKEGDHAVSWGNHLKDIVFIEIDGKEWLLVRNDIKVTKPLTFVQKNAKSNLTLDFSKYLSKEFLACNAILQNFVFYYPGGQTTFSKTMSFEPSVKKGKEASCKLVWKGTEILVFQEKPKFRNLEDEHLAKKKKEQEDRLAKIRKLYETDTTGKEFTLDLSFWAPDEKIKNILVYSKKSNIAKVIQVKEDGEAREPRMCSFLVKTTERRVTINEDQEEKNDNGYHIVALKSDKEHVVFFKSCEGLFVSIFTVGSDNLIQVTLRKDDDKKINGTVTAKMKDVIFSFVKNCKLILKSKQKERKFFVKNSKCVYVCSFSKDEKDESFKTVFSNYKNATSNDLQTKKKEAETKKNKINKEISEKKILLNIIPTTLQKEIKRKFSDQFLDPKKNKIKVSNEIDNQKNFDDVISCLEKYYKIDIEEKDWKEKTQKEKLSYLYKKNGGEPSKDTMKIKKIEKTFEEWCELLEKDEKTLNEEISKLKGDLEKQQDIINTVSAELTRVVNQKEFKIPGVKFSLFSEAGFPCFESDVKFVIQEKLAQHSTKKDEEEEEEEDVPEEKGSQK